MIGYLAYLAIQTENDALLKEVRKKAAYYTDEKWDYYLFDSMENAAVQFLREPSIHLISWDVTSPGSLHFLEQVRREKKDPFLLIVADERVSPVTYLRPVIAPGALLLKPFNRDSLQKTMEELFEEFSSRFYKEDKQTFFTADSREGRLQIPTHQIDYFEAREKKIYLRADREEYGFYSTLEEVLGRLPEEFVQCHRSYVVNMKHVRKIDFGSGMAYLMHNIQIPVSRSRKKALKEHWDGR